MSSRSMPLDYSLSLQKLHDYVENYNAGQTEFKNKIRGAMTRTAQEILRIYGAALAKANNLRPLTVHTIPSLRTNNRQLAKLTHQSGRTIQRHIKRLMEAGIITDKIGHGSNSSYELLISPKITWISVLVSEKSPIQTEKTPKTPKTQNTENQFFKNNNRTKCPHTDTRNTTGNINNILIGVDKLQQKWQGDPFQNSGFDKNISGDTKKRCPLSLPTLDFTGNTITGDTQLKDLKKNKFSPNQEDNFSSNGKGLHEDFTGNTITGDTQKKDLKKNKFSPNQEDNFSSDGKGLHQDFTGNTQLKDLKKNDGARLKEQRREETAAPQSSPSVGQNDPTRHSFLVSYARELWLLAKEKLYKNCFLTARQCAIGEELLYDWYDSVKTPHLPKAHREYKDRIAMVEKYIAKNPTERFVQLPFQYFDISNKSGFAGTKSWYKKQNIRTHNVWEKRVLKREINKFKRNAAKDTGEGKPLITVYRECEQRIGKLKNEALTQEFYQEVQPILGVTDLNKASHMNH